MEIIIGREGTQKTPISDPTVSRKHCKVTDNGDGTYIIENLSRSGTKVDGVEILKTTANLNSRIQLGPSFSAALVELIGVPQTSSKSGLKNQAENFQQSNSLRNQQSEVKTFNISHLRKVWEDYNNTNIAIANAQRKVNLIRVGFGIFTLCAMPTIYFIGPLIGYTLTFIGILGNVYSFIGIKNSETVEERQRRQDAFDDAWVCPNPDCGHSLLAKNYRMLVRNHQSCPFCKCRYVEK